MVRKQLYIAEHQERALKARAAELGVSEAEFVRAALDRALEHPEGLRSEGIEAARRRALTELRRTADALAASAVVEPGRRWTRDDFYDDERSRRLER